VTTTEIQKHLDGFGLPQEFGTYGKIRGLSGGQKVKLVLAAAFWTNPHLVVLDEPTNFLDREALGALSAALNHWGGAVLMISHNKEFYSSVCREEWVLEGGRLSVQGDSMERAMKAVARKKKYEKEDTEDLVLDKAGGNVNVDGDKYKDATVKHIIECEVLDGNISDCFVLLTLTHLLPSLLSRLTFGVKRLVKRKLEPMKSVRKRATLLECAKCCKCPRAKSCPDLKSWVMVQKKNRHRFGV
jgi:ABC-type multidrug transport system ATPase subunit